MKCGAVSAARLCTHHAWRLWQGVGCSKESEEDCCGEETRREGQEDEVCLHIDISSPSVQEPARRSLSIPTLHNGHFTPLQRSLCALPLARENAEMIVNDACRCSSALSAQSLRIVDSFSHPLRIVDHFARSRSSSPSSPDAWATDDSD